MNDILRKDVAAKPANSTSGQASRAGPRPRELFDQQDFLGPVDDRDVARQHEVAGADAIGFGVLGFGRFGAVLQRADRFQEPFAQRDDRAVGAGELFAAAVGDRAALVLGDREVLRDDRLDAGVGGASAARRDRSGSRCAVLDRCDRCRGSSRERTTPSSVEFAALFVGERTIGRGEHAEEERVLVVDRDAQLREHRLAAAGRRSACRTASATG